jgi:hypothetical protein
MCSAGRQTRRARRTRSLDFNTFLTFSSRILIHAPRVRVAWLPKSEAHGAPEIFMNDLIFIAVMIAFFALAALYARFCEKI